MQLSRREFGNGMAIALASLATPAAGQTPASAADAQALYEPTRRMSNQRLGATVIYDDREVFYDVGLRLKGSAFGRNNDGEAGCNIEFDPSHPFRGVHRTIALERSGAGAGREILGKLFLDLGGKRFG